MEGKRTLQQLVFLESTKKGIVISQAGKEKTRNMDQQPTLATWANIMVVPPIVPFLDV